MRAVIQKVKSASVSVNNHLVSEIGSGLLVLVGISQKAIFEVHAPYLCRKIINTKLWEDENSKMWKKSVKDMNYDIILVSQFTLHASLKKNHPDYHRAMTSNLSKIFFERFVDLCGKEYSPNRIKTGQFGEMMQVKICNDGPVTLIIEKDNEEEDQNNSIVQKLDKQHKLGWNNDKRKEKNFKKPHSNLSSAIKSQTLIDLDDNNYIEKIENLELEYKNLNFTTLKSLNDFLANYSFLSFNYQIQPANPDYIMYSKPFVQEYIRHTITNRDFMEYPHIFRWYRNINKRLNSN